MMLAIGLVAAPAAAQFSDSYKFLKAVRDRDGTKVTEVVDELGIDADQRARRRWRRRAAHRRQAARCDLARLPARQGRAARTSSDAQGNTPLALAAQIGFGEGVSQPDRRAAAGSNIANNQGETPLILAVQARDLVSVRLLLEAGANPALTDRAAGLSARDYAARDRRSAAILKLIDDAKPVKPAGPCRGRGCRRSVHARPDRDRDRRAAGGRRGGRSAASRPCGGRRRAGGAPARGPPRHRSDRRRSARRSRAGTPAPRTAPDRSRRAPPRRSDRNNRDSPATCASPRRSARETLISTIVRQPLASIAIRSARRPLGSGTSHSANRSCRKNSRQTPRATSRATSGASAKQSGARRFGGGGHRRIIEQDGNRGKSQPRSSPAPSASACRRDRVRRSTDRDRCGGGARDSRPARPDRRSRPDPPAPRHSGRHGRGCVRTGRCVRAAIGQHQQDRAGVRIALRQHHRRGRPPPRSRRISAETSSPAAGRGVIRAPAPHSRAERRAGCASA